MPSISRRDLLASRGPKNKVDPRRPYAFLVEQERSAAGKMEPVATIFLTNKECPFSCVYCDLWKNTTDRRVQPGDIPAQIDYALSRLPPAKAVKLYNSGNFFDPQAIPPQDHDAMAAIERLIKKRIERVLVPSFEASGASVAVLMGDEPRRDAGRGRERDRGRERGRDRGSRHQPGPSSTPKKASDPIFSAPYEPGSAPKPDSAAKPEPEPRQQSGKRRQPQVAALLGGLKRA